MRFRFLTTARDGLAQLPVARCAQRAWRHDGSCGVAEERIVTPRAPIHKHRNLLGRVAPRRERPLQGGTGSRRARAGHAALVAAAPANDGATGARRESNQRHERETT